MLRIRDLKEEQTTWTRKCCSDGFANKARLMNDYNNSVRTVFLKEVAMNNKKIFIFSIAILKKDAKI